ncbi:stage II sporulation protein E [Dethiothermospora halolimnae]|uniref:stage II sporulation protein E n=1 Tax=Dethiothermospora halolimnae TaxID=3114390 RepID=UPI003CCBBEDB
MINKTEILPARSGKKRTYNKITESLHDIKGSFIIINIVALFISRASIMDNLNPFGIAFLAAVLFRNGSSITIPIMTSIGILTARGYGAYSYLAVGWFIYLTQNLLLSRFKKSVIKASIFSSISFILIRGGFTIIGEYFIYDLVMIGFEGIIVFTLTYIFNQSVSIINGDKKAFTNEELICATIMLALVVSGIGDIKFFNLALKNIICGFLVISFSYTKGPAAGTAVGVTMGIVCGMSTPNMPVIISVYGFSGLLSGLFKELGKLGTSVGFIVGNGIMTFYINNHIDGVVTIRESLVAILLFVLLNKFIKNINIGILEGVSDVSITKDSYSERLKEKTYKRLSEISNVFEELATTFERVADKEKIAEQKDISDFIDSVANDVCKNCSMYRFCWEEDFYQTYQSMFDVMSRIETKGSITEGNLPKALKKNCIKKDLIIEKSNYLFDIYKLNYRWENKIVESRRLVSEQLEGVSKIINDLACEIDGDISFKEEVEKEILNELKNNSIDIKDLNVIESKKDNFEIIIETKPTYNDNDYIEDIVSISSKVVGFDLTTDNFTCNNPNSDNRFRFKLIRANRFGAITKVATINDSFNYVSGDSYTFGEKSNNYYAVLSDGMGMGEKANQESDITITLLEKFLEAGFDKELALKTINSILVLKSTEEIFATIDMSMIDLYRGKTQFIKIGSAPTFIKTKKGVKVIDTHSLPVGILKDVDFQIYEEQLEDGDIIVMMSDGVLDANDTVEDKEGWMKDVIDNINSVNPQSVANKIINESGKYCNLENRDDMTVLVTKVWKRRRGTD